jgi:hypothetical protein
VLETLNPGDLPVLPDLKKILSGTCARQYCCCSQQSCSSRRNRSFDTVGHFNIDFKHRYIFAPIHPDDDLLRIKHDMPRDNGAKLKALLRKAAERSVKSLWNRIACLLNAFQPDKCANYFRNSGYAAS